MKAPAEADVRVIERFCDGLWLADAGVRLPGDRRRANRGKFGQEGIAIAPDLAAKIRSLAGDG